MFEYVVFAPNRYPVELDHCGGNPYDIALVSHHWRDIACSTPQLWVILPGNYPQLWGGIVKRSGTLPLRLEWHKKVPETRQDWPPKILEDPSCSGRLQGLNLKPCSRELIRLSRLITPGSSLRHIHMEGEGYDVWDDRRGTRFLTFIQSLPRMTYLGLGGGCVPLFLQGTSAPLTRFSHPNLRRLYLKGLARRVFRFLHLAPLRTLEGLELQVECLKDVFDITCRNPQAVFRDFWAGQGDAPRSLAIFASRSILEITLGQCQHPGREPDSDTNAPLLKFTASGFGEATEDALERLGGVLPLAEVEELVLHNVSLQSSVTECLLRLVPQVKRIVTAGSDAKAAAGVS